jgi:hypothetical protein
MENVPQFEPLKPSQVSEIVIFKLLWGILPRKSFITGLWLREFENTPFFFSMFCHVLAKGQNKYPYFKHYMRNIVLLTPLEHHLYDNGTADQRISYALEVEEASGGKITADWGRIEALRQDLLKEYREHFPTTRGLLIGYKYDLNEQQKIIGMLNKKYIDDLKNVVPLKK